MGQFRRRQFLVATSTLLAAQLARGQPPKRAWRIGVLSLDSATAGIGRQQREFLNDALRRAGFSVGKDLIVEWRFAEGKVERLPQLADEVVRLKVDVIVPLVSVDATRAVMQATRSIPIVMHYFPGDAVELGVVASLARPGANVTGTLYAAAGTDMTLKQYQILKEAAPTAVRVAALWRPTGADAKAVAEYRERLNKTFGFEITDFLVTDPDEVLPALRRIAAFKPHALFVGTDPILRVRLGEIAEFAIQQKLISFGTGLIAVREGLLLYYGPDVPYVWGRTVSYVDRILRGANPAELAVEQPIKYELVINAKTARAIGYNIPPALQLRADRVIE